MPRKLVHALTHRSHLCLGQLQSVDGILPDFNLREGRYQQGSARFIHLNTDHVVADDGISFLGAGGNRGGFTGTGFTQKYHASAANPNGALVQQK